MTMLFVKKEQKFHVLKMKQNFSFLNCFTPFYGEILWNDKLVEWVDLDKGLSIAKNTNKPLCFIIYANWCPRCREYSNVFNDPAVTKMSKKFVMVKIDEDANEKDAKNYIVDGKYVPRTFFIEPNGKVDQEIKARNDRFFYFYSDSPQHLISGMKKSLDKHKLSSSRNQGSN